MSYFLRLPVYNEQGIPVGFFSSEALKPEQLTSWYHRDPATGDTTHPAHTTD